MMSKNKYTNKIEVPITEEEKSYCKICDLKFKSSRALAGHLNKIHKLKLEDYLSEQYLNGRPTCKVDGCDNETRYLLGKYMFNKYCKEHAKQARSEWSKDNATLDYGWRKGLTKETHSGIASQSEKMKGEGNVWYGKEIPHLRDGKNHKSLRDNYKKDFFEKYKKYEDKLNIKILNPEDYISNKEENLKFLCLSCQDENITSAFKMYGQDNVCIECWDRSHSEETKKKISDAIKHSQQEFENICSLNEHFDILTPYSEYRNKFRQKLDVQCRECKDITKRTLSTIQNQTMCWKCNPRSIEEVRLEEFLTENQVTCQRNTRDIIGGKELDFYLPKHKFAIEYNGLYWHCEKHKPKNYHREKTNLCKEKGIRLFHLFDDEWHNKKEIIQSMILSRIGKSKHKINARECKVVSVSKSDSKTFFNKTHISGHVPSKHCLGLIYEGKLVSCLSLRNSYLKKYDGYIEIARFSSELNTVVVGGLGKLMKKVVAWCEENGYIGIMTYADLRFGEGKSYEKVGFMEVGETGLDYWYTDGLERYHRFKYRARDGFSEKQVAELNEVSRVYGCGSKIYQMEINKNLSNGNKMRKIKDCVHRYEVGDKTPKYSVYLYPKVSLKSVAICLKNGYIMKKDKRIFAEKNESFFSKLNNKDYICFGKKHERN